MSQANAQAFLQQLMVDRDLVEQCKAATDTGRLRIAADAGYPHTSEDMQAVIADGVRRARETSGELSDKELHYIAGGAGSPYQIPHDLLVKLVGEAGAQALRVYKG
jgi:predicted ribosomally synthesized peptide with nif11-like leader